MADEFVADLAVVVGIGAYDTAVGRLETPVRDAEAVADLLMNRFGYEMILRCDVEATLDKQTLLSTELLGRVPEGSRLLLYFAGHGVAQDELEGPQGYLVRHGATSDIDSHLPMRKLYKALKELPCRHLLVILDFCFSGSFRWASQRPMLVPGKIIYEERYQHWVRHPACWALASSAHNEHALDIPDRRRGQKDNHSPFASALLAGLAGEVDHDDAERGNDIVTLAELYAYVLDRLVPHQTPLMLPLPGQTKGAFIFRDLHRARPLVSAEQTVILKEEENPSLSGQLALPAAAWEKVAQVLRRRRRRRFPLAAAPRPRPAAADWSRSLFRRLFAAFLNAPSGVRVLIPERHPQHA